MTAIRRLQSPGCAAEMSLRTGVGELSSAADTRASKLPCVIPGDARRAPGDSWAWSLDHREVCCVLDREELWGDHRIRIWLLTREATARVPPNRLRPIG